jgi:hypothetical protein
MTIYDTTLAYTSPATKAWSVWNQMRGYRVGKDLDDVRPGLFTRTAIYERWRDSQLQPSGPMSDPLPISWVDDGIAYLVGKGWATFDGTTITPLVFDTDGRPHRLRRIPIATGDALPAHQQLELLPNGATPQDGT